MAKLYYDKDINDEVLRDKIVSIIGYGSQGHAHAQNLKDSGFNVIVGLYSGSKSKDQAEADGFEVYSIAEAVEKSDLISMCIPDPTMKKVFNEDIKENLSPGDILLFAHGFAILYEEVKPPDNVDVVMIAPKAPGHRVRAVYKRDLGVPCLIAVEQDFSGSAYDIALAYGKGIGGGRAGILETTFKEETETDLFGEQAVLCGGVTALIKAGFEVLTEAGYQPESAYFEVLHELKLIVDLIYQGGLEGMRYSVSTTAEYGDYTVGPRIIDDSVKDAMKKVLDDIQSGRFAKEWIAENDEGLHKYNELRDADLEHPVEKIGKELRDMMPWLESTT